MPFVDTTGLDVIERLPGWHGRYFHSANMTFAHYDFTRGASIHEHFHPEEEVYEVIEGELELSIDGVPCIARPGLVAIVPCQCSPFGQGPHRRSIDRHRLSAKARFRGRMTTGLPLPTLLSQVLVAFTIEFDNEFEHQMPHRTSNHGGSRLGPWLASMAMWANCMQFIGEEGVPAGKLADLARTTTNLNGMVRWGYIVIAPDPADKRPKPPRSQWIIRATPKRPPGSGGMAAAVRRHREALGGPL